MADQISSNVATLGSEPGILSTPQSNTETPQPTVVTSNMEGSVSPSQLDNPASNQIPPSSRPSERSALSKEASVSAEVPPPKTSVNMGTSTAGTNLPDRSRISVGAGSAVVETKSAMVGPSVRGSWKQQGDSRIQSRRQSKTEGGLRPSSPPSALNRPPDRSRVSVEVGRSVVETKSARVNPSVVGSWKEQRGCKTHSQQPSQMDDRWRTSCHTSLLHGPPDRSRVSVGVGCSTKSVGVGRSLKETVSERVGPSKPCSKITARNSREPRTGLQEYNIFHPPEWLGTVEEEDSPAIRTTSAASPRPSNRASRVVTPPGGLGSRVDKDMPSRFGFRGTWRGQREEGLALGVK